jgi:hypothetical protein
MTLLDDIARAIMGEEDFPGDVTPAGNDMARAAIAVFARWLREPPEELAYQATFLRALADHLEREK